MPWERRDPAMKPDSPPDLHDDHNPYAPPRTDFQKRPKSPPGVVPFDPAAILVAAWNLFSRRPLACLSLGWTVFGLAWLSQEFHESILREAERAVRDEAGHFLIRYGMFLGTFILNFWLNVGQDLALLRLARGEREVWGDLFGGWPWLSSSILAALLVVGAMTLAGFVVMAWLPVAGILLGLWNPAVILVAMFGMVLGLAVAGMVGLRLSQFQYLIIDESLGPVEALRRSWELTQGRVGMLVVIFLFIVAINLAGILMLIVGVLFTLPFTNLLLTVTYLSLSGKPLGTAEPDLESLDQPEG
jgi:hypothetical protein